MNVKWEHRKVLGGDETVLDPNFNDDLIWIYTCVKIHRSIHKIKLISLNDQFSHSVVSDSLQPHGLRHARPPCPSPTAVVYSDSCPLR